MTNNGLLHGISATVRSVLCWCGGFWLLRSDSGMVEGIVLLPFLLGSLGVYAAMYLYLRRERSMLSLVLFAAVLGAALAVGLTLWGSTFSGNIKWLLVPLAAGTTTYLSARACVEGTTPARSITGMELTTLFFLVCLWIQSTVGLGTAYSLPVLGAVLVSLVEVCYLRLSGSSRSGKRGLIVVAAVLAGIFALLGLFLAFGADTLAQTLVLLTNAVMSGVKWLANGLYRLLLWLFSRLPDVEVEASVSYVPPEQIRVPEMENSYTASAAVLIVAVAAFGLYALVLLLRHLGTLRIGGRKVQRSGGVERHRLSLGKWLLTFWNTFKERIALEWILRKNTPQGLYLFLLRSGRSLHVKKGRGESPAAFVRRMAALTAEEEILCTALTELAPALERALYADGDAMSYPAEQGELIRRSFRRTLRKARLAAVRTYLAGLKEKRSLPP